jgi:hypothetical protein
LIQPNPLIFVSYLLILSLFASKAHQLRKSTMSHNASTHTANPSAVNYDFPANAQAQPSQDPQYHFPDVSPLGSEFTDAAMPGPEPVDERQTLWRSIYALGANMDSFVQSQHANAEATQSVLGALVERLTSTGVGGSGSSKNGVPKF